MAGAEIPLHSGPYFLASLIGVLVLALNPRAIQADDLTPTEAKALAEEAFICGFAIVENYKAIFGMCVYEESPQYSGFNHYLHGRNLFDPDYKVVVSANNDTLYSTTFAELSTEPLVVSVPPTGDRYQVIQLVDMFTNNFAYIGTRETGREGGNFVLVGPSYTGSIPTDKFDRVIVSRSHFFALATRTAVDSAEDVKNVAVIQDKMELTPLSKYLGTPTPTPKPAPAITFPPYNAAKLYGKPELLAYMNTFLEWQYPALEEAPLMRRLAKINVGPGRNFRLADWPTSTRRSNRQSRKVRLPDTRRLRKKATIWASVSKGGSTRLRWVITERTIYFAPPWPGNSSTPTVPRRPSIRLLRQTAKERTSVARTTTFFTSQRASFLLSTHSAR